MSIYRDVITEHILSQTSRSVNLSVVELAYLIISRYTIWYERAWGKTREGIGYWFVYKVKSTVKKRINTQVKSTSGLQTSLQIQCELVVSKRTARANTNLLANFVNGIAKRGKRFPMSGEGESLQYTSAERKSVAFWELVSEIGETYANHTAWEGKVRELWRHRCFE